MNKSLIFCFFLVGGQQVLNTACHKDPEPVVIVTPIDTIVPIDTTVIIQPDSTVNYRYIYLTATNTNQPIANCAISLFTKFFAPFCSDPNFLYSSNIGTTDSTGKFTWKWDGQPLPPSTYIGAGFGGENNNLLVNVSGIPPKTLSLKKQNISFVKLHIDYRLDTLPATKIELLSILPGVNCYAPQESPVLQLPAPHPFDTTIVLARSALFTYSYKVRYLVDFSTYDSYLHSGLSKSFPIAFPAVDTAYMNIVIE